MSLAKLAKTTLLTKGTDAVGVIDAYKKPDLLQTAVNSTSAVLDSAKRNAVEGAVAALKGAAHDKELISTLKGAARGKISKDVALSRLKEVVGGNLSKSLGDPKDLKDKLLDSLTKSAGFNLDAKGLVSKLNGAKSFAERSSDVRLSVEKYAKYGIKFDGGALHCSDSDGKGLLDMLNGALGKNKFKGIDFGLKFDSLGKLFNKLPHTGMFDELMDVFDNDEEKDSFLSKGLKGALDGFNFPHLKLASLRLGGWKLGAEFPDFNNRLLSGFKKLLPQCEIETPSLQITKREELKFTLTEINPKWHRYTRDDSNSTGKGDGTGGTGQAVEVHNLEPFTKMSDDAVKLLRTDPDPDMQLNLLIADNYKSVRLAQYGKALYPHAAYV